MNWSMVKLDGFINDGWEVGVFRFMFERVNVIVIGKMLFVFSEQTKKTQFCSVATRYLHFGKQKLRIKYIHRQC